MKRRPPSLRRVAIEDDCPGFSGTIRTLRLRSAPSCLDLVFLRPGCTTLASLLRSRAAFRCLAAGTGRWLGRSSAPPFACRGGQRISQVPAQTPWPTRSCSFDPGGTGWSWPYRSFRRGHGLRQRPWLPQREIFRGSIAWPGGLLSTLQSAGSSRHDARLASGCAATLCRAGFAPAGSVMKGFSYVSVVTSHPPFASLT